MRDVIVPAPAKPKKIRQNQPVHFKETLTPALPAAGLPEIALPETPALSRRTFRFALIGIWAAATVIGGVGIGRLLTVSPAPSATEAPVPVATATVGVTSVSQLAVTALARPDANATLSIVSPESINQAQAGTPFQTASINLYQLVGSTLQPSFAHFGRAQGNIGTMPVN